MATTTEIPSGVQQLLSQLHDRARMLSNSLTASRCSAAMTCRKFWLAPPHLLN